MAGARVSPLSTREEQIDSVSLLSWGANSYGQLGQGHKEDQLVPGKVITSSLTCIPQVITGGGGHTLITIGNGSLWVSGSNSHGQLGLGNRVDIENLNVVSFPFPVKIAHVSGGWDFTLACSDTGDLYSWGSNAFHQLGRKTADKCSALPDKVDLPVDGAVVCVAAGLRHGLALTVDGSICGWGQNKKGQVGQATDEDGKLLKTVPLPVQLNIPARGKLSQLTAGAYHSGALTDVGEVFLWGCNKFGQLTQDPSSCPYLSQPVCLSDSTFNSQKIKHIVSGWTHNLGLTDSGHIFSWGRADYGQLGRPCGDKSCDPTPVSIPGIHGVHSIACGSEHNLVLTDDDRLICWGWNEHGMCGTGDESNVPVPRQVTLPAKCIVAIGCGAGHSFALVSR